MAEIIDFMPPRMETIQKTAKLFGLPEHFVRQKVLSGEIVAVNAGRRYLVNVDKFAEYLNNNTISAPAERDESGCYAKIQPIPVNL